MTMPARSAVPALMALTMAGLLASSGAARAEGEPPQQPRFAFAPVEGGALKMDTQTGQVSLCTKGTGGFACTAVPDTRDAYEAEITRLQAEIATLKKGAAAPGAPPQAEPSDVDRALDYATHLYRRFRQLIDEMKAPDQSETL
ncbi:hypothetical protein V5F44_02115 [Xanthobacter sp. V2C-8]|uniref:hypothetical protein n=1 Tax=Xanthobacter albus TaxID=3119929 RepID=UPI00372707A3